MQNYFETDFVTVSYDKANHLLILKWKVTPTSDEFREGLNSLIPAMEYFKTGMVIGDTTYLGAIHPNDQQWSATEWVQSALQVGHSKLALIIPSDVFTKMSMDGAMSHVVSEYPIAYFDNMEDAIDWIKKSMTQIIK